MKMVLIRKLADRIDDIDLRPFHVGECMDVQDDEAQLLAAEGWAVQDRRRARLLRTCIDAAAQTPRAESRHG